MFYDIDDVFFALTKHFYDGWQRFCHVKKDIKK